MTTPTVPRTDGRSARRAGTREAIMDAATELFAARGVTSTSIDDIAAAAGIAKGSIYYNFESKAGLVEAIMARNSRLLGDALAEATRGRSGTALRDEVVRVLLRLVQQHASAARVMVTELFRTERSWRESIEQWRGLALSPLIADLRAHGADPVVAGVQAASIVGATLMAGLEWLVFHPERSYEQVASAVLGTLDH
ncbi:MAG: TetR/AcrR family transcriptional regulator [Actinobacteria bacterium]|uniref:TetR/AcrR family transcriptional regulator n=1 Tax=Propionicimonas sp. T2.31MG-18 TaxID=3157620 RepID=UPI0035EBEACD|nr:TetR/AcrR family transcriptional regulator [Actinomycetota bacterium]MCA0305876.1 TetR/AcrR family transcriptional regulator [Actinomycetota bacterium]